MGILFTWYVAKAQDAEMRDNLTTYAKTIEQSIDWRPFSVILNTSPDYIRPADLEELEVLLNSACKANRDCHFIYLLYGDKHRGKPRVKFLLDASPQPASEISQLAEVFVEATDDLKQSMQEKQPIVEGPVTDHWGTWVSARVPVSITIHTPHFVMLNIDVAVKGWNQRILKKTIIPIASTLLFLGVLLGFIYQNRKREKLLAHILHSTSALSDLANNDALTGLPNRRLLEDRMLETLEVADQLKQSVGVLFLDLDYFKEVNDTHGHFIGDQLLKAVAERLRQLQRTEDTIARIGGDEFVILLPKLKDEQQAEAIAEKIVSELARPFSIEYRTLQLGVSIGIAVYPKHNDTPHQLVKYADDAMYVAKRKGRNCYAIYEADTSE